jgi:ferredoxin--NADP+ reductase
VSTGKLCSLAEGEHISDAAGPLGRASRAADHGSAVFVAGGVGVAEIYPVAREMSRGGSRVSVIMGARDKEHMICEEEIRTVSEKVHIITDDGSYGLKGLVTDILPEVLEKEKPELVYAVGPVPMMSKVADMTRDARIKTLVSLDALMVDGTGMCGCCRIRYAGGIKFACYDGPEFDAHLVDFADLMNRAGRYRDKERKALEEYRHRCRSGLHDTR